MLEILGLKKAFAGKPALDGVSFKVGRGEIHGLLGHNGAGKSTTLGIILGMVMPDHGEVKIGGMSVQEQRSAALRKVGAIFESPSFYDYLSGWDNLRLLMGYSDGFDAKAAREIIAMVDLTSRIHSKVRTYSHGMRQRLALAQALLPEPEILLLDEPTDGLDPEGIRWFRDFILRLRKERGMTVLFNSHLLSEVELMCDRVTILRQGRLVFEGEMNRLQREELVYETIAEPWDGARQIIEQLGGHSGKPGHFTLPPGSDPAQLVNQWVHHGISVRSLAPVKRSLEEVYLELTERGSNP